MDQKETRESDQRPDAARTLGDRLRQARQEIGMHQEDVCEALGLTVRSLTRWENGQSELGLEKAARLAEHYRVSLDWIAGRTAMKAVVRPGMVLVDRRVVTRIEELVEKGKGRADARPLLRNPGLDYVFEIPEDAEVLDPGAARTLDTRVQAMFEKLGRNEK